MKPYTLFARWETWWLGPIAPHALAIIRIITGTVLTCFVLSHLPYLRILFSSEGVTVPLSAEFPVLSPAATYLLFCVLVTGGFNLALGYRMRLSIVAILLSGFYFWEVYLHLFPATFHRLLTFVLVVLFFSGADRTLSLRMKHMKGAWDAWEPVCALPQRLLMVQLLMTYIGSGWQKFTLLAWQSGEVLYYGMMSDWGTPLAHAIVALPIPITYYDAAVWAVVFFEFVLPFALLYRPTQKLAMIAGILFHVSILFLLSIWSFVVLLVPLYITLFPPEKVREKIEKTIKMSGLSAL